MTTPHTSASKREVPKREGFILEVHEKCSRTKASREKQGLELCVKHSVPHTHTHTHQKRKQNVLTKIITIKKGKVLGMQNERMEKIRIAPTHRDN